MPYDCNFFILVFMLSNAVFVNTILFLVSFVGLWFGSGLIIAEVTNIAKSFRISSFTLSFFLLGMLTSLPEITIGISAIMHGDPQIFVGNLIGGVLVIFLLIIPLLSIVGNGITFPKSFGVTRLIFALFVCIVPSILASDKELTTSEGVVLIALYIVLFFVVSEKENFFEKFSRKSKVKGNPFFGIIKMLVGLGLLVSASGQIVDSTEYFAGLFSWSPFLVSLILVSIGTNIPELSLVVRSVFENKKDVALADYVGSASANTLLFGVFSILYGSTIVLPNHFVQRLVFIVVGIMIFYFFSRSKNKLSRIEAMFLVLVYVLFVFVEIQVVEGGF